MFMNILQMFMHHHNIGPADAGLFLNGIYFDMETTDIFTLLQYLKQETRVLEALHKLQISVRHCLIVNNCYRYNYKIINSNN